jgi:hypothetical protein
MKPPRPHKILVLLTLIFTLQTACTSPTPAEPNPNTESDPFTWQEEHDLANLLNAGKIESINRLPKLTTRTIYIGEWENVEETEKDSTIGITYSFTDKILACDFKKEPKSPNYPISRKAKSDIVFIMLSTEACFDTIQVTTAGKTRRTTTPNILANDWTNIHKFKIDLTGLPDGNYDLALIHDHTTKHQTIPIKVQTQVP